MSNTDRAQARAQFMEGTDWAAAVVEHLTADASFRRYFRLRHNGRSALLMDAPPPHESATVFISIARHLSSLGLSVPRIHATDETQGFAIVEDFGDDTYTLLLNQGSDRQHLYELAIDALCHLHAHPNATGIAVPPYDIEFLVEEASLLVDWYLPALRGTPTPDDISQSYRQVWSDVLHAMPDYIPTLVLRDYHVDNLMLLPDRNGVEQCGLLDFQDARIGHPAYDLVSLLQDARRDVPDDLVRALRDRYAANSGYTGAAFDAWYVVLGVQRHAKVAGIFVRLHVRDGKPVYLHHIPRVMGLLSHGLSEPALAPVKQWFDEYLPDSLSPLP